MWTVGETFVDVDNDLFITIDAATPNGFIVTLGQLSDSVIFSDSFEFIP